MSTPPPLPPAENGEPQLSRPIRWMLMGLAVLSLVMGVIGIFLPVLPTVPFILLAAWAAARSSPRLSHWLENHPHMGPPIREWRRGGVVSRAAKWWATTMMSGGALTMLLIVRPLWVPLAVSTLMAAVAVWLWQRPEAPPPEGSAGQ